MTATPIAITAEAMEARLREVLAPTQLQVLDESWQHEGHPGANGTGQHGCSVNIESFRIYVAMAVDQHGFGWNRRVVISVQPATRPDRGTCPG